MLHRGRFVIAAYEERLAYGGPEEGGWWYATGDLRYGVRKLFATEEEACKACRRRNDLMCHLQRGKRPVSSAAYEGGRYCYYVYFEKAPDSFPDKRPHYE